MNSQKNKVKPNNHASKGTHQRISSRCYFYRETSVISISLTIQQI
nr:MAG TPA: hypothetical protein [Caudoviricetes sp.]